MDTVQAYVTGVAKTLLHTNLLEKTYRSSQRSSENEKERSWRKSITPATNGLRGNPPEEELVQPEQGFIRGRENLPCIQC